MHNRVMNAGPVDTSLASAASLHSRRRLPTARSVLFLASTRRVLIAVAGGALMAAAAYLVTVSPPASSRNITLVWAAVAVSVVALGLYAAASKSLRLPGRVLASAAMLLVLWLLLASGDSAAFTTGWLLAGLIVPLVGYEMLASSTGRTDRAATLLLLASSIVVAICWTYLALTSRQPDLMTPLGKCRPACPRNALFAGASANGLATVARVGLRAGWLIASFSVALGISRHFMQAGRAVRRSVAPTLVLAVAYTAAVAACVAIQLAASNARPPLAWVSVIAATVLPFAMLAGLVWERLLMGEALEEFVNGLRDATPENLRAVMAQVLHDPSVQIGYAQPAASGFVDASGATVDLPETDTDRVVTAVHDDGLPDAVIIHRDAVPDQERFIRAAGAAALIFHENHCLKTDLSASMAEVAASRKRLVEAGDAERQRIERDLHDGIQQRVVGARVKLELADEALDANPARGRRMLAEIGCDLDDAVREVRLLAQGVYPALLTTHGLVEALRSVARRSPGPVTVRGHIARYPADTEAAVYFCCLEALQNVAKHAGPRAAAAARLWEEGGVLRFQIRDSGVGFSRATPGGRGLVNMRDRLAAVGGSLTVRSGAGVGTIVEGCVSGG